ncbi:MAG TPA: ABC transporter ATP-binding protein [Pyrinomonadaceae bacterium]|jgi:lipopolysaccharide transport system ATP-binding protein|nr:ABC transporter ATP-binding protein [Pyrinomonadaceae bacterium]
MTDTMIRAEGLGKRYELGVAQAAYSTLRESLTESLRAPLRAVLGGRGRRERETVWALRDVGFEVARGEVVALVGGNGAGKSTLLKILSRITEPTEGRAALFGRVGSLLEVGTGFHPELTGRENIHLSGAILGMSREEIRDKFDEIVEFAEVEKFIDTPVKRYSSGMYMRLAFAVAAHLEPEILLVDEVLAVGDAAFQKKCLGKMSEVAHRGRTVLFVSHNMTAVSQLCPRTIMLKGGRVERDGRTSEVVAEYLRSGGGGEVRWDDPSLAPGNERVRLRAVRTVSKGEPAADVDIDQEVRVEVEFWSYVPGARNLCVNIYLLDGLGHTVLSTANTPNANLVEDDWYGRPHEPGLWRAVCTLPANFLNEGLYYISVYVVTLGPIALEVNAPQLLSFNVFDTGVMREAGGGSDWAGVIRVKLPWRTELVAALDGDAPGARGAV